MILSPKNVQSEIKNNIINELKDLDKSPNLVIIRIGDDFGSKSYEKSIYSILEPLGINIDTLVLDETISQLELNRTIEKLNEDDSVTSILILKPLPKHLDEKIVDELVNPIKDVDGTNPINLGKLLINDKSGLIPCTPEAVIELLDYYNINTIGKNVVIINRSNLFGKPLALLLTHKDATVTLCNSKTKNLEDHIKGADILITATGVSGLITPEMLKEGSTVIDVTVTSMKDENGNPLKDSNGKVIMSGDIQEGCKDIAQNVISITPNCGGGIGSLTTTILAKNVLESYKLGK